MTTVGRRPLKLGLYIPNGDGPMGMGVGRWGDVVALARRAEAVGFDSIWVADHLLFRFPGVPTHGRWECWSILAALAAATERVELGPIVSCMSFRNPALLAKMAETVDEISGGRLILGLGAGWHEPEYVAYGYPFDRRVDRFEEGLRIVHGLLFGGPVSFEGRHHQARDCELRPRGPRPGGPPILIGSRGPRMIGLAARYADSWNTEWTDDPSSIQPLREVVDAACRELGRDPATLSRSACVHLDLPMRQGRPPLGEPKERPAREPEAAADYLRAFAAEGIDHAIVWLDPPTVAGIEAFARTIELLDGG